MSRGTIITLILFIGLGGVLLWSTLRSQTAECTVCVEFNGQRNCATASAASEDEATRSAQTTACGVLTNGMNETIACQNRPPVQRSCRM
ncbi:MAG TPA: hypothetical protein VGE02_11125 [Gemmatimonadales bacterium]